MRWKVPRHWRDEYVKGEVHQSWGPDEEYYSLMPKSSSGASITGVVQEQGVASTGDFIGLNWVDILVITASPGRESLIATEQRVYDHAGCILDLDDLLGYHVWATERRAATLDTSKDCNVLTAPFWSADNRCCDPDTATYRECE
jgi:hypothetical protein